MLEKKGLKFTKMQGIGNDYIYVNVIGKQIDNPSSLAIQLSDRHFGIGSDGLVLICESDKADFRMRMFNPDGSEAEMCGNASRCVGKYVYDKGLTSQKKITLETKAGIRVLHLSVDESNKVSFVKVDMGVPVLEAEKIPVLTSTPQKFTICVDGEFYEMISVSMGNPHAVTYVEELDAVEIARIGPMFEHHKMFPERTNTEFVTVLSPEKAKMRVWERGAGETLACGTGACAVLVAGVLEKKLQRRATIQLTGGDLMIEWDEKDNHVYMTGPAVTVFEGIWE